MSGKTDNAVALASTLAATAVAKKAVDTTWKMGSRGKTPPTDPADPDIDLREAILFALISGAVVSVVRLFIARKLAEKERREARVQSRVKAA
jgi:Protein of unknown function (DUF4235)